MGINIRYFIITIISIFFALGIGIFIGFMFDAQAILTSERDGLVESLNDKFHTLEKENRIQKKKISVLINENKSYKDFNEYIFPHLTENRLSGITVGLIQLSNDFSYNDIKDIIIEAGGKVILFDSLEASNIDNDYKTTSKNSIEDERYSPNKLDYFLVAATRDDLVNADIDALETFLSQDFTSNKQRIIVIGNKDEDFSNLDRLKNDNVITINSVDSTIGKISLIFALDSKTNNSKFKSIINRLMKSEVDNFTIEE